MMNSHNKARLHSRNIQIGCPVLNLAEYFLIEVRSWNPRLDQRKRFFERLKISCRRLSELLFINW